MRLLLVEDDEQLGSGIQRALKRDGNQVDWLLDGTQACSRRRLSSPVGEALQKPSASRLSVC